MHLVVDKNLALPCNPGTSLQLRLNNPEIRTLLSGSNVPMNSGAKNKMYANASLQMHLCRISPTEKLTAKLLDMVCDHLPLA